MKQILKGDLLILAKEGYFDVIVHGCNCFCTMDAGIALPLSRAFPEARIADHATPKGDRSKLGTVSLAPCTLDGGKVLTVANAYTQYHYQGAGVLLDYRALERCFLWIAKQFPHAHIGYPKIGSGLAGGDWARIAPLIDAALADHRHTLVIRGV